MITQIIKPSKQNNYLIKLKLVCFEPIGQQFNTEQTEKRLYFRPAIDFKYLHCIV